MVELTLRNHAHPNFIRWSICNGNKPRVFFVRMHGVLNTGLGLAIAVVLALSSVARWWRILAAIPLFLGITTLVAAWKGLCIVLHHSHGRALKPWEQFSDNPFYIYGVDDNSEKSSPGPNRSMTTTTTTTTTSKRSDSQTTFGSRNSKGQGIWMEKYRAMPLYRKIFDRTVFVQNSAVRLLQDKIVRQSQLWALLVTVPLTVLFTALPKCNLY